MSKNTRIILFLLIGISMSGLVFYGLFYSKKLENQKELSVNSNIGDYLYDEARDTVDLDDEEEDLDGEDAIDEDDDFEVYNEDDDWGEEPETNPKKSTEQNKDEDLEELYDNTAPKKEEPKQVEVVPVEKTPSNSDIEQEKYLVIAGSFSSIRNAKRKIKTLEKKGFKGEIIQLKNSDLQTVIAGRFAKESDAEELMKRIESQGLRAIVKEE